MLGKKKRTFLKQKEEQKKETGNGPTTQLPGPFGRLLRPIWFIQWTPPIGEKNIYINQENGVG